MLAFYQLPSVAFAVAGSLAPLVVIVVIAVTLFLAVPLFCYTAGRSPHGHGTIGLLERVVPGWRGKLFVVVHLLLVILVPKTLLPMITGGRAKMRGESRHAQ